MLREHARSGQHRTVISNLQKMTIEELQDETWNRNLNNYDNGMYAATMVQYFSCLLVTIRDFQPENITSLFILRSSQFVISLFETNTHIKVYCVMFIHIQILNHALL